MAGENRSQDRAVATHAALEARPYAFGFFRALRLLECAHPDRPRLGRSKRPADDPVRLGQEPTLAFAPATLAAFRPGGGGVPRLLVYFLGLFGPNGPLPLHLTEYARDRARNADDPTFERFVDLFHHRLLSLFYRAWADAEPTVHRDRPDEDRFATYVGALFGMGMPSVRGRDALPDAARLYHAGHLACPTRHPSGLKSMISDYFRLPVRVEEFVGQWIALPESGLTRLGGARETARLGDGVTVGGRVWECQQKFRIVLGPLSLEDYRRLLPGGRSLERLTAMVRGYAGDELDWDVRLILRREDAPSMCLGRQGRLGWTTWMGGGRRESDPGDLLLSAQASAA